MNGLRWVLGVVAAAVVAGWAVLVVLGSGFRSSFGASENSPLMIVVPAVVASLVLASLVWPERRLLLHIVAVLVIGLCVACLFLARETIFVATMGMLYAIGWLVFYYRVVSAGTGLQAPPAP